MADRLRRPAPEVWEDQFTDNPQAALCEAAVRDIVQGFGFAVEPVADLKGQGLRGAVQRPDFRCSNRIGAFYVEVAHISIAKATELTNLPYPEQFGELQGLREADQGRICQGDREGLPV